MDKIEFEINNNRTMQLVQQGYNENITFTVYNNTTSEVDYEENISSGDMVMLINYYKHIKQYDLYCDFVNPNGRNR